MYCLINLKSWFSHSKKLQQVIAFTFGVTAVTAILGPAGSAHAAACKMGELIKGYQSGIKYYQTKYYDRSLLRWSPLAEAGFGPAQRRLATLYQNGHGVPKSINEAAFWAMLAFRSGDAEGRKLSSKLRIGLDKKNKQRLNKRLSTWRAKRLSCGGGSKGLGSKSYNVSISKYIPQETKSKIRAELPNIIKVAQKSDLSARVYMSVIDRLHFYNGSRYDRYVGWRDNSGGKILQISAANFFDHQPDYFARAVTLAVKRRVYDMLPDSKFDDPLMRLYKGKKIFGSVYPDIRNGNFFKTMRQAFEMSRRLPKNLQRYLDIIDEIHYNPASKHFIRSGTTDAKAAFYVKNLSTLGHRMMFVRRKVLFSSPLFFLQTIIHEGTHAFQDQIAQNGRQKIPKLRAELDRMDRSGKGNSGEAARLKRQIHFLTDYVNRWFKGIKTATGRIQDIAFECESTENEIKTVQAVGAPPSVMKASGYLKLCPNAQKMIIAWQDELISNNKRR